MRFIFLTILSASLMACALPRGAAIQSEVIGKEGQEHADIAVYRVSKETLPDISRWLVPRHSAGYSWPGRGAPAADKVIRAYDRISMVVWDSEEVSLLSGAGNKAVNMDDMEVSSAGTIFLPFVGSVHVAGKSQAAARNVVQRKYEEVIPSAQVQLKVTPGTGGTVSVVDGVSDPGPIQLSDPNFTVLNAIAAAGGPTNAIKNPEVKLIRGSKTYRRPLSQILENASYDIVMQPGDKVAIDEDKRYFRSLGAASRETIVPFERSEISALDAVSMIGGLTDTRANPKGVLVLREYPSNAVRADQSGPDKERTVFVIDLTSSDGLFSAGKFKIADRDTVLVTESSVVAASTLLGVLDQITGIAYDIDRL